MYICYSNNHSYLLISIVYVYYFSGIVAHARHREKKGTSLADLAGTEVLRLLLWCSNVFWDVLAVPHRHSGRTW